MVGPVWLTAIGVLAVLRSRVLQCRRGLIVDCEFELFDWAKDQRFIAFWAFGCGVMAQAV